MRPFIKIGKLYINVKHIIDIDIRPDVVRITTSELVPESVGESDWTATNNQIDFEIGTPEADALLRWADSQAEVLF